MTKLEENTFIKKKGKEAIELLNKLVDELPNEDEVCMKFYLKKEIYNSNEFQEFVKQLENMGVRIIND